MNISSYQLHFLIHLCLDNLWDTSLLKVGQRWKVRREISCQSHICRDTISKINYSYLWYLLHCTDWPALNRDEITHIFQMKECIKLCPRSFSVVTLPHFSASWRSSSFPYLRERDLPGQIVFFRRNNISCLWKSRDTTVVYGKWKFSWCY